MLQKCRFSKHFAFEVLRIHLLFSFLPSPVIRSQPTINRETFFFIFAKWRPFLNSTVQCEAPTIPKKRVIVKVDGGDSKQKSRLSRTWRRDLSAPQRPSRHLHNIPVNSGGDSCFNVSIMDTIARVQRAP